MSFSASSYLSKYGWDDTKGLGKKEDGRKSHIRVAKKNDVEGIGLHKEDWSSWNDKYSGLFKMSLSRINIKIDGEEEENSEEERRRKEKKKKEKKRKQVEEEEAIAKLEAEEIEKKNKSKSTVISDASQALLNKYNLTNMFSKSTTVYDPSKEETNKIKEEELEKEEKKIKKTKYMYASRVSGKLARVLKQEADHKEETEIKKSKKSKH